MVERRRPRRLHTFASGYTSARVAGQACEFLGFLLLARRLGASAFGQIAVPFLICRYAGLIADWGANLRGARDVARNASPWAIRSFVQHRYLASAVLTATYLAGCALSGHLDVAPLGAAIVARGVNRDWLALGHERAFRSALPSLLQGLFLIPGALLVAGIPGGALAIAVAYGAGAVTSVALNPLPAVTGRSRERVPVSTWLLVGALADQVCLTADTLLIGLLRSDHEAGIYAAVYRIPNGWMTVTGLATAAILPGIVRHLHRDASLLPYLRRRALRLGALTAAVIVLTIPISVWLVPVLFGPEYTEGQSTLVVLLLASAVTSTTVALTPLYWALHGDRLFARWYAGTAAFNVASNLWTIPRWGMPGAAATMLATTASISFFLLWNTRPSPSDRRVRPLHDRQKLGSAEVAEG
jgi:O-antigen/teichoic acid export membrane protein